MTPAELWEEYRPRIAEARDADRRDVQTSLVSVPELVGKSWVMPMTIARLLYLEAINHPFLSGAEADRDAVLDFLWIMSPEFKAGNRRAAKKFFRRYWLRRVDPEPLREYLASEFESEENADGTPPAPEWVAHLVDVFASEYGWSEAEIHTISLKRLFRYGNAIVARRGDKIGPAMSPKADRVKAEYLVKVRELEKANAPAK